MTVTTKADWETLYITSNVNFGTFLYAFSKRIYYRIFHNILYTVLELLFHVQLQYVLSNGVGA